MYAKDFRALARQALAGRWGVAVGTGLVAMLLGGAIRSSADSGSSSVGSSVGNYVQEHDLSVYIPDFVWMALVFLAAILSIYAVVCFVVGGTVQLGYAKFNLARRPQRSPVLRSVLAVWPLRRRVPAEPPDEPFHRALVAAAHHPRYHRSLQLRDGALILYENPGMRPMAALKASKELMRGNKWRLFCLQFSFIGWALLCALTAGIGNLWLCPYQEAAQASFYRQICWERSNGQPNPGDFHQQTQFDSRDQQNRYNNRGPEL